MKILFFSSEILLLGTFILYQSPKEIFLSTDKLNQQIHTEFSRLQAGGESIRELLEAGLQKYGDSVIKVTTCLKKPVCLQEAVGDISLQRHEKSRSGMKYARFF